ncbi:MAG: hypothetical protein FWC67_01210 [Defluviitaleaceae bacterium]|nr:hypothetical protein [Defluviitaleaceae bacterium]
MKRYDAIKIVGDAILADGLVEALFLKGSIARGEDDDYSDVDMYAVVCAGNLETFLDKRIQYMETYMPLVWWTQSNFVGPQIVGVFEDALHFDLYTVQPDSIPQTDDIKVIFDKNNILDNYKKEPLSISAESIPKRVNSFAFSLLEFETAYIRKDYIWAITLFHFQLAHASFITRFVHDPENAQLALKRIHKGISDELHQEFLGILQNATPANILTAMKDLTLLLEKVIDKLPADIKSGANMKFFEMMKGRIWNICIDTNDYS